MRYLFTILTFVTVSFSFGQTELSVFNAIERALKNNYDIQLVMGNYDVAKLQNSWGQAGIIPTFSLNIGNTASLQDNTNNPATFFPGVLFSDNLQASLGMSWTVFSGFAIRINKQRFEQLQAQTRGNALVVIETTIYETIMAYYTIVVQERKLGIIQGLLDYSKEKLAYHTLKQEMGVSTSFDLKQFENQVYTDSSNLLLQELAYENAQRNLNLLFSEDVEQRYTLTDSLAFETTIADFDEMKKQMMVNNLNLKNQYINTQLQQLNLEAQKSSYYPVVTLNLNTTPSVGYFRLFGDEGFSASTNAWAHTGVINVRYDIFQGWNRKRNVEIANIQVDLADVQTEQLSLRMEHQLKSLYDLYRARIRVSDLSQQSVKNAITLWELGKEKYDLGTINVFNLNDIKLTYQQATLSYYDRLFESLQSHYDLLRIMGGIAQQFNLEENFDRSGN